MADGPERRWNQIGETLPDPGTGFSQEKILMVESFNHSPSKIGLFRPEFKTRQDFGQSSVKKEIFLD